MDQIPSTKQYLLKQVMQSLEQELKRAIVAAKEAREGSTHKDAAAKSKYETQSTELSYLADGQAMRAEVLNKQLRILQGLLDQGLASQKTATIGSLVNVEIDGKVSRYFLLPVGAGTSLNVGDAPIKVISPSSPFGAQLMGSEVGEEVGEESFIESID